MLVREGREMRRRFRSSRPRRRSSGGWVYAAPSAAVRLMAPVNGLRALYRRLRKPARSSIGPADRAQAAILANQSREMEPPDILKAGGRASLRSIFLLRRTQATSMGPRGFPLLSRSPFRTDP